MNLVSALSESPFQDSFDSHALRAELAWAEELGRGCLLLKKMLQRSHQPGPAASLEKNSKLGASKAQKAELEQELLQRAR